MQKLIRGTIASLVILGLTACVDDPFAAINGDYDTVSPNPQIMYIAKPGDSSAVLVRLINAANNGGITSYTVSGVGAGIAVHYDAKYRPEFYQGSDTLIVPADKNQQRYWVVGVTPGEWTFTLTATANTAASTTVKVRVEYKSLGDALSTTTAVAGDEVTITAPPGTHFTQTATVTFPTGALAISERDPDGKFIKILVGPGITGAATVNQVVQDFYPSVGNLSLATTNTLTTPALTVAPTTLSSSSPAPGASMTVALGGSLRFQGNSTVTIGGVEAALVSVSADSSTATVVPAWGSSGAIAFTNVALKFLTSVKLNLPSDKSTTAGAGYGGSALAGASTIADAPVVALPTVVGRATALTDQGAFSSAAPQCGGTFGGNGCRVYKLVVPASQTFNVTGRWDNGADIGLYRTNSTGGAGATIADNLGDGSGGQPESGNLTNLTAGTYYLFVVWYQYGEGPVPPNTIQLIIKRTN